MLYISLGSIAKHEYKVRLSEKITPGKCSCKDWWKTIKYLLGKDNMEYIPPLIQNRQLIDDPKGKANAFNQHIQSQTELNNSNILVSGLPQSFISFLPSNSS